MLLARNQRRATEMLKSFLFDKLGPDVIPESESVDTARLMATCASLLLAGSIIVPFASGWSFFATVALVGVMLILALVSLYILWWIWTEYDSCLVIKASKPNALLLSQTGGFFAALIAMATVIPLRSFISDANLGTIAATLVNAGIVFATYSIVKFYNSRILRFG